MLALEQYRHGHSRGASEDHSRVIRHAYSRPEYTALTPAAYQSWNVAERGTGLQLMHRTGGLILAEEGSAGAAYVAAAAAAMGAANLPFEQLTGTEVMRHWPQWRSAPSISRCTTPKRASSTSARPRPHTSRWPAIVARRSWLVPKSPPSSSRRAA